ncbi:MAG: hypothetical protein F6K19_48715 [Cyanothece sp. SIO1E1]|nr:hypothetical protein [Cyanothece sp. SIO1E1]
MNSRLDLPDIIDHWAQACILQLAQRDLLNNDAHLEATDLDARMAAEVTEIMRRLIREELF